MLRIAILMSLLACSTSLRSLLRPVRRSFMVTTRSATSGVEAEPSEHVLCSAARSYAALNGILMSSSPSTFEMAPVSLLPQSYPLREFTKAQSLSTSMNSLLDRVSTDSAWLNSVLSASAASDPDFTGRLLSLHNKILAANDGVQRGGRLGIIRSDYMLSGVGDDAVIKQIELNTIASSFAGLSTRISQMHSHIVRRFDLNYPPSSLPSNSKLISNLASSLSTAHNSYLKKYESAQILFVVQDGESNTADQNILESTLFELHDIKVIRKTLQQITADITVIDNRLILEGFEISVCYFRSGYAPKDYGVDTESAWRAREIMESSISTCCPTLGYQLTGTKKVQQELAREGGVERFVEDEEEVERIRGVFAGLWAFGGEMKEEDKAAAKRAMESPEDFVMKPQREGGGYNFYGKDIVDKMVEAGGATNLDEFILMERLNPPKQDATLLRGGEVEGRGPSLSELGIFSSVFVNEDGEELVNKYDGYLLRTKFDGVDEGGVASGFATLSSISAT